MLHQVVKNGRHVGWVKQLSPRDWGYSTEVPKPKDVKSGFNTKSVATDALHMVNRIRLERLEAAYAGT